VTETVYGRTGAGAELPQKAELAAEMSVVILLHGPEMTVFEADSRARTGSASHLIVI
jgi:hypothetical protein